MAEESKLVEELEKKQSEIKFTDDEMNKLISIRDKYSDIQYKFGQSAIMKLRVEEQVVELNTQVESLKEDYRNNQTKESEFLEEINNKYGEGELNPETGIFTSKS